MCKTLGEPGVFCFSQWCFYFTISIITIQYSQRMGTSEELPHP